MITCVCTYNTKSTDMILLAFNSKLATIVNFFFQTTLCMYVTSKGALLSISSKVRCFWPLKKAEYHSLPIKRLLDKSLSELLFYLS